MLGVPMGYRSFCTRGYSDRLHYLEFEYEIAKQWAQGNPLMFVIYGGSVRCRKRPKAAMGHNAGGDNGLTS